MRVTTEMEKDCWGRATVGPQTTERDFDNKVPRTIWDWNARRVRKGSEEPHEEVQDTHHRRGHCIEEDLRKHIQGLPPICNKLLPNRKVSL